MRQKLPRSNSFFFLLKSHAVTTRADRNENDTTQSL